MRSVKVICALYVLVFNMGFIGLYAEVIPQEGSTRKELLAAFDQNYKQASSLYQLNPSEGIDYAIEALNLARVLNDSLLIGNASYLTAITYSNLGEYERSFEHYTIAIPCFQLKNNQKFTLISLWNLGYVSTKLGAHELSNKLLRSIEGDISQYLPPDEQDKFNIDLGHSYYYLEEFDKAIEYYKKGLNADDDSRLMMLKYNLASILFRQSQFEDAIVSYKATLELAANRGDFFHLAKSSIDLGIIYSNQGKTDKALKSFAQAKTYLQSVRPYSNFHILASLYEAELSADATDKLASFESLNQLPKELLLQYPSLAYRVYDWQINVAPTLGLHDSIPALQNARLEIVDLMGKKLDRAEMLIRDNEVRGWMEQPKVSTPPIEEKEGFPWTIGIISTLTICGSLIGYLYYSFKRRQKALKEQVVSLEHEVNSLEKKLENESKRVAEQVKRLGSSRDVYGKKD